MKKMLIIVDMVNGFVKEGALADPSIMRIVPKIEQLIVEFKKLNYPIVAFKDCHTKESSEFNAFPAHCLAGSEEVELVDALKKYENDFEVFEKNSTSGLFVPAFYEKMLNSDVNEVVITGCCTDICVLNLAIPLKNLFNQLNRNIDVVVIKDAVDTYHISNIHDRDEYSDIAFRLMAQAGVKIIES